MGFSVQSIAGGYSTEIVSYAAFSPTITRDQNGTATTVNFAQAYVIDYNSDGKRIRIDGMDTEYALGGSVYINITVNKTKPQVNIGGDGDQRVYSYPSTVTSATLSTSSDAQETETLKKFSIKVADLDQNGIKEMYIQENIHWFHFFYGHA